VIVAALISLAQIQSARSGKPSVIAVAIVTLFGGAQTAIATVSSALGHAGETVVNLPRLSSENARLTEENRKLAADNAQLNDTVSKMPGLLALTPQTQANPAGIVAQTIAYDPEAEARIATIDRGTQAGVQTGAGVIDGDGAVGRIVETTPFFSKVQLLTDTSSKIPALVQHGRWWGIVVGTGSHIEMRYIAQDAKLTVGDTVITADGHAFYSGLALGRIISVSRPEGGLYQAALLEPAVAFGRLGPVLVLTR
jgi:rod shape-determining protein MreC